MQCQQPLDVSSHCPGVLMLDDACCSEGRIEEDDQRKCLQRIPESQIKAKLLNYWGPPVQTEPKFLSVYHSVYHTHHNGTTHLHLHAI